MTIRLDLHDRIDRLVCPRCQGNYTRIYGTFFDDQRNAGRYSADLHRHDGDRRALLSIGTHCWQEGPRDWEACCVTIEVWTTEEQYEMALRDAAYSPYKENGLLGRVLDRVEALASSAHDQFFHLADHVVTNDPRVRTHLENADN
jgi:hypothetical protein